ncbi:protein COFACTOR ASSEMBLY OF COMPLEX C SUBUNIT B CCB3, chloroplastic [Cornus florida]|uniref:protein COFACTOR ASSEMBLY OF COMPLEX C SUBUNIT B CCB3, chloroplastic n=1 Tax=Cornus florida TaxID=4283 RepID=UPI00289EA68C|nr:protein COFACTOR ASSEMBLY OF COMPLEX C SUBUNIT B CCB3, chloroplastic [Cornus florida]
MEKSGLLISRRNIIQNPFLNGGSTTQKLPSNTSKFRNSSGKLQCPTKRNPNLSLQSRPCCSLGVSVHSNFDLSPSDLTISEEPFHMHGVTKILGVDISETSHVALDYMQRLVLLDLDPATAKLVAGFLGPFLSAFGFLFIVRIVMSWYPKIPVGKFPYVIAYAPTEPLLNPTRKLIPPLGGVDVTPVVWFGLISFISEILVGRQGLLVLLSQQV